MDGSGAHSQRGAELSMASVGLLSLFLMTCGVHVPGACPGGTRSPGRGGRGVGIIGVQQGAQAGCTGCCGRGGDGRPWAVVRSLPRHPARPRSLIPMTDPCE